MKQDPLFIDFTWGAGGATSELTLDLSTKSQAKHGVMVNMHLTCTNQEKEKCDVGLAGAKAAGICNIVALRGDPPKGQEKWEVTEGGFACALDLIKYMRANFDDYFSIQCAGYPEGHPDRIKKAADLGRALSAAEEARVVDVDGETYVCSDEDFEIELNYLKEKCDAGADVIITQLFYDFDVFVTFVKACRAKGITVPIVPGIMPLNAHGGFKRMTGFCKTRIPPAMAQVRVALAPTHWLAHVLEWPRGAHRWLRSSLATTKRTTSSSSAWSTWLPCASSCRHPAWCPASISTRSTRASVRSRFSSVSVTCALSRARASLADLHTPARSRARHAARES